MTNQGFHEAQAAFLTDPSNFVGQVRRFGPDGPAYEVVGVAGRGIVAIEVIESGERLDYALEELVLDPVAETVP
jgi:Family of unknown function (DUF5397)